MFSSLYSRPKNSPQKSMYILEINSLPIVSFAIICSHSEGGLFTLLIVSFAVQNLC